MCLQSCTAFICTESELTPEAVKITLIAAKTVSEPDLKKKKNPQSVILVFFLIFLLNIKWMVMTMLVTTLWNHKAENKQKKENRSSD